ncbi:MAG: hypothetical protein WC769_01650 [Thermodesulfovibrionales bacterium]|jgi:hypothetical protein
MGADYEGQEKAIEELRALSPSAKEFLSHHLRNSLSGIITGVETGKLEIVKQSAWHIIDDLVRIGC